MPPKSVITVRDLTQAENVDNKYGDVINFVFPWADGETAARYSTFFNATNALEPIRIEVSYTASSTSGTLQIEKLTGTQAPGAGASILTSTISLAATANTVITREQRDMTSARTLKQGDRLAFVQGGVLTGIRNLVITIYYKPLGRGGYR